MSTAPIFTSRLIIRPFIEGDLDDLFLLDSNPEVMKFLGNNPVSSRNQINDYLNSILNQYESYNIGRWVVLNQSSGQFMGWSGIKFMTQNINDHQDFYDVGYRFLPQFWGQGYATECTRVWIEYAQTHLTIDHLYASTHIHNIASQNVLKKTGFKQNGQYLFDLNGEIIDCFWFDLKL